MARVSVIMPVYNVEPYLAAALASLEAQTFTDFEAILVNDGSTDSSRDIAQEFCERDPRFVLVDQDNTGPGPGGGRNGGLPHASGELLAFMDSDDVVLPTMLAEATALFDAATLDMVTTSAQRLCGAHTRRSTIHDMSHPALSSCTTSAASPWLMFDSTPWNKIFQRNFFDEIVGQWPSQQLYEDIAPMTLCHLRSTGTGVLASAHYLWRARGDGSSITQQRHTIDGDLAQLAQLRAACQHVREHGTRDNMRWFSWKAYTFDFVWMIHKLSVLGSGPAKELVDALQQTMLDLGTEVVPYLSPPARACIKPILEGRPIRAQFTAARQRIALGPDRRHPDAARLRPTIDAVLLSHQSVGNDRRLLTATDARDGVPSLVANPTPPWLADDGGRTIEPTHTTRRGPLLHSTFDINRHDLDDVHDGETCFVTLRTSAGEGELRRSLRDRVAQKARATTGQSPLAVGFEGRSAVLLPPPVGPSIEDLRVEGDQLIISGTTADQVLETAWIADGGGGSEQHLPISNTVNTFTFAVPLGTLNYNRNYFLAYNNSNTPDLPAPLFVKRDTLKIAVDSGSICALPSADRQAYLCWYFNLFAALRRN